MRRFLITALMFLLSAFAANAVPITYLYGGIGSGTLGGTPFNDAQFLITARADTDNIMPWPLASGGPQNTHLSAAIEIDGLGVFDLLTPSHTWLGQNCCGGLGRDLAYNWITLAESGFIDIGYGLDTNLGPISEQNPLHVNQFTGVSTGGGILNFGGSNSIQSVTFTAIVSNVPEPTTFFVVGGGLAALVLRRRRARVV